MKGFVDKTESIAVQNRDFRQLICTARSCQWVLMSLKPGEDMAEEGHKLAPFFRIGQGVGEAVIKGQTTAVAEGSGAGLL